MHAGIFLNGVQVGKLKNWTLKGKYKTISDDIGAPQVRKKVGWTASVLRYRLDRDLCGEELEFRFCGKINYFVCRGKIADREYTIGKPIDEQITMSGEGSPAAIFRSV